MEVREASAKYLLEAIPEAAKDEVPPGYKRTGVGVIPEDWSVRKLTDLAAVRSGLTYHPDDIDSTGTLVLRSSNIQDDTLSLVDRVYVSCAVPDSVLVEPGDILVCVRNGSQALIGKCALIPALDSQTACGAFRAVLRSTENTFVLQQFRSECIQRQIREMLGATINQITNAGFRAFLIPFPTTLFERRAIATALSDTDALITALQQLIDKKRAIKQGAMQELLTGRRRLPGFDGEWERKPLGVMLTIRHGKNQSEVVDDNGPYPILATGGKIGTATAFLYDKPSVLIGRKGTIDKPQFMSTPFWTVDTLFYSEILNDNDARFLYY